MTSGSESATMVRCASCLRERSCVEQAQTGHCDAYTVFQRVTEQVGSSNVAGRRGGRRVTGAGGTGGLGQRHTLGSEEWVYGVCAPLSCHQSGQGASSQHKPGGKQARVQSGTCQDDFLVPAIHPTTREFRQFDGNHRSSPRSLFLHLPHAMGYRHSKGGGQASPPHQWDNYRYQNSQCSAPPGFT